MMANIMNYLFGPLGKEYCIYFYGMTVFSFMLFIFSSIHIIRHLMNKSKTNDSKFFITSFLTILYALLVYFINRLMYTMCLNSTY
jgi:hypothetical protein